MSKQIHGAFPYLLFRKTKNGKIIKEIDGLRFLAILPVVLQHLSERLIRNFPGTFTQPIHENPWAFAVSRGSIGVLLFFAISGFVLALPFIKIARENKTWSYRNYFYRRITRIEPPYLIWMTLFMVVLLVQSTYPVLELMQHYTASIFYLHNLIYDDFSIINPVAWSLEIEIQFYLIAPLLVLLLFKIPRTLTRHWITLLLIIAYITLQHSMGWQYAPYKFTLLGQFQHFLTGVFLADIFVHQSGSWRKSWVWDFWGVLSLITMMYTWTEEYFKSIAFFLALCMLILSGFRGRGMSYFFSRPWIVAFGGMCYTIYLIHLPLLELVILFTKHIHATQSYMINLLIQSMLILPIIAFFSIAGYLLLEKPFMDRTWPEKLSRFIKQSTSTLGKTILQVPRKLLILLLFTFTGLISLTAQTFEGPRSQWPDKQLAPLETLVSRAIARDHQLKRNDLDIEYKKYELNQQKWSFLNYIGIGGGMSYGNGSVVTQNGNSIEQSFILQNRQSLQYNAGISAGISLGDMFNHRSRIKMKEIELEKLRIDKVQTTDQIRQEVVNRYQKVLLSFRILESMLESKETGALAFTVADKYFQEGEMPIEAFTQALDSKANRELALEKSRLECIVALYELKDVVGPDIY